MLEALSPLQKQSRLLWQGRGSGSPHTYQPLCVHSLGRELHKEDAQGGGLSEGRSACVPSR